MKKTDKIPGYFTVYVPCQSNPYYYELVDCDGKNCTGILHMYPHDLVFNPELAMCDFPDGIGRIVKRDVVGAVAGGILASPGGAGAATAGALGGAIVESATGAIERFLDWLF